MPWKTSIRRPLVYLLMWLGPALMLSAQSDPGVRKGALGAGGPVPGLASSELQYFLAGLDNFQEVDSVEGPQPGLPATAHTGAGLGARYNADSCATCHAQPAIGGSSPFTNPQIALAAKNGATNKVPFFLSLDGPVRVARFKFQPDGTRDGGVHDLFTITGRYDASGCNLAQPDFAAAAASNNLIFRIPTPVFGAGLMEAIPDSAILQNKAANGVRKTALGISSK